MSQGSKYSAYWESQNAETKIYNEAEENNPDYRMMNEASLLSFEKYSRMNRKERRRVRAHLAAKALIYAGIPVSLLYLGIYMDNAFIIVPAIFLTIGMLIFSIYYMATYLKLVSIDIRIARRKDRPEAGGAAEENLDPIDRLKTDFQRSEMETEVSNLPDTEINKKKIKTGDKDPFRRK